MTPPVKRDSHRGRVVSVLSTTDWMDCHEIAAELNWSVSSASSVLSDIYRPGYVERREKDREFGDETYEYRLDETVRLK